MTRGDRTGSAFAIDFVVAGGAETGLGHVVRCATLAVAARRRGWRVRAYLDGDEAAEQVWRERTEHPVSGPWQAWLRGLATHDDPVVALDFPASKEAWLTAARAHALRSLVIDDERATSVAPDYRLLPGLHHIARLEPRSPLSATHRLAGGHYAILAGAHRATRPRALAERSRILVTMGGADPTGITPRIAPGLRTAIDRARQVLRLEIDGVDVVLGPAFRDPNGRTRDALARLGFDIHHALPAEAMARCMAAARLAIVGFGTSLTELAWHGTPFLSVVHHASDLAPARALADVGIGRVLGTAETVTPESVATPIGVALADTEWQRASIARARAALDGGLGARRLFDRLELDAARRAPLARPTTSDAQPGVVANRLGEFAASGPTD